MQESLKKRCIIVVALTVVLSCLLYAPIRMGTGVNKDIPLIGAAESVAENYCEQTLIAATKAYVAAKLIDKCISTLQQVEISFTPFGMGVTVAPGEMLAAVNEAIERVSSALFTVIGIMLVEKLLLGMLSWVSFKVLLPVALGFGILYCVAGRFMPWSRSIALFLASTALLCWLFLPLTALVSGYVEEGYLGGVYAEQMEKVEGAEAGVILEDVVEQEELRAPSAESSGRGWFSGLTDGVSALVDKLSSLVENIRKAADKLSVEAVQKKATEILNYADDATDRLFHAFCIFVVTTILIPLFSFFVLCRLVCLLTRRLVQETPQVERLLIMLEKQQRGRQPELGMAEMDKKLP